MSRLILFALVLLSLSVTAASIYRTTDEQGNVVFTDAPPADGGAAAARGAGVLLHPEVRRRQSELLDVRDVLVLDVLRGEGSDRHRDLLQRLLHAAGRDHDVFDGFGGFVALFWTHGYQDFQRKLVRACAGGVLSDTMEHGSRRRTLRTSIQ